MTAAQDQFASAKSAEDFAMVGDACSAVLLLLLQAVYVLDRDQFAPGSRFRLEDSVLSLLESYISTKLNGPSRDAARANLILASSLHTAGTTDPENADMCLKATTAVVKCLSISSGRRKSRETIGSLCERFLAETKDIGKSHGYTLQRLAREPIAKLVASELTREDLIAFCRARRSITTAATLTQDITYLRGLFARAREEWRLDVSPDLIDIVKRELLATGVIGRSNPRTRRPTREELQRLVDYFEEQSKDPRTLIPMKEIMEFALWSARRISEICSLRWDDLNEKTRTCIVRVNDSRNSARKHEFPLLGKAWDIVQRQPRTSERIFPYYEKSAGARYIIAKKKLGIENLRFQDLRREAAIRLYEAGHSIEQIARVTGRMDLNTLLRDITVQSKPSPADTTAKRESSPEAAPTAI
jgi:integrase